MARKKEEPEELPDKPERPRGPRGRKPTAAMPQPEREVDLGPVRSPDETPESEVARYNAGRRVNWWFGAQSPGHLPYPCRCSERLYDRCNPKYCLCAGRADVDTTTLPIHCCARTY